MLYSSSSVLDHECTDCCTYIVYNGSPLICRGVIEPLKKNIRRAKEAFWYYLSFLSIASISSGISKARSMSAIDLSVLFLTSIFWIIYGFGHAILKITYGFGRILLFLMRGDPIFSVKKEEDKMMRRAPIGEGFSIRTY